MKQFASFLSFIAIIFLFVSCNGGGGFLSATGSSSEVLVIMDDSAWEGSTGRALFDVLNTNAKALPQPEPNFRILHIKPEDFSSTFKMARNIIIPEISNIYSQPKLDAELDKYAMGQVIMTVKAQDNESFVNFVTNNKETIVNYFIEKELERSAVWLKSNIKLPVTRVQQVFGINIHFPKGIVNFEEEQNFLWATNNLGRGRQDIVIYQFPYKSESVFEKDSLIKIRNEVLGEHIKGAFDSQMTTAEVYSPDYRTMELDGVFRAELRGLWEMTTDMMGGPFVMHAFVNDNTGMVIVVEAYVYAPEMSKRNLMRSLEATLYTISVPKAEDVEITA
mgnify:CR=1 FL=1